MTPNLAKKNGSDALDKKIESKISLQEALEWVAEPKRPMLCIPTGVSDELGGELLKEVLPGLLTLPVEIVILGKGSAAYGSYLTDIVKKNAHRIGIVDEAHKQAMYEASDMALFLADATDREELSECLRHGVVPVCMKTESVDAYNPNQESGEAFLFEKPVVWHCFGAVVRALETYRFPFDWKTIQKHCIERGV
jgi:starch synthase